jgi:hypothetical protein
MAQLSGVLFLWTGLLRQYFFINMYGRDTVQEELVIGSFRISLSLMLLKGADMTL